MRPLTLVATLSVLACGGQDDVRGLSSSTPEEVGPPEVTEETWSLRGHAQECVRALGPIPSWDVAADTLPIPVPVLPLRRDRAHPRSARGGHPRRPAHT